MLRRPGKRAVPIYPIRVRACPNGGLSCGGLTRRLTDSVGDGARPCEFLNLSDAQWFAAFVQDLYRRTNRASIAVFVQHRTQVTP